MPFKETCRMEQRVGMLADYDTGAFSVTELCARYGVSRDTFYFWAERRQSGAPDWFADRSHAPLSCPHRTAPAIEKAVVAMRRRFGFFGPRKIKFRLERERPDVAWPAASVIGDILKRAGLVKPVRRRRPAIEQGRKVAPAAAANNEWCVDFKGWFRTRDGSRIDPLTITDAYSRYLLDVRATAMSIEGVRPVFERAFRAHGLPQAIRSDNGSPFGSKGAGGLTRLSVWWVKLGIEPHFIRPASPQENGRHERMHRTLKDQTAKPPAANAKEQQRRFDRFRRHFNEERPHEALDQTPPSRHWSPSPRQMPSKLADPWYDADHQVRRVRGSGEIRWRDEFVFVSEALTNELVGIAERDFGHVVRFCNVDLGVIGHDGRFRRFAPIRYWLAPNSAAPDGGFTRHAEIYGDGQ
jgi:transposase InsO family protein